MQDIITSLTGIKPMLSKYCARNRVKAYTVETLVRN
jgi:hypothetical protein